MSLAERFKGRKPLSRKIEVRFPKENPEFVFEFSRIPKPEVFSIQLKTIQSLDGLTPEAREQMYGVFFTLHTYESIARHLKDWEYLGEEPFPYSKDNAEALFSGLETEEIAQLVGAYSEAIIEDEKKSKPAE